MFYNPDQYWLLEAQHPIPSGGWNLENPVQGTSFSLPPGGNPPLFRNGNIWSWHNLLVPLLSLHLRTADVQMTCCNNKNWKAAHIFFSFQSRHWGRNFNDCFYIFDAKKKIMRVFCTADHAAALLIHFHQLIAGQTQNICSISGFLWVASLINKCSRDFLIFGIFFLTIQKPTQAACNSSRQEIFHCVGQSTWKWFTCTWVQSFWHRSLVHSSLQSFLPQTSVLHANQLLVQGLWKRSVASN